MATATDNATQQLANKKQHGYEWIDLTDPCPAQLEQIAVQYALHDASIEDMLAADHLPKYERLKQYTFIILRYYAAEKDTYADTVEELTNKIAVVIGKGFIITIHRHPWEPLSQIYERKVKQQECESPEQALVEVVRAVLTSYEAPAHKLNHTIDLYEEQVFLKHRKAPMLKGLYYIKRKVEVIRRLLILSYEVVDKIDPPQESTAITRDIRDLHIKQHSVYDALADNISQLLAIYFNVSAQRTNEIIRILTIFSVFFLPLTFIVGIYGMNFRFMPELNWKAGYPAAIGLMVLVTAAIYYWFRRNNWL